MPLQVQRSASDCLPTCAERVLRFYGVDVDPAWLYSVLECTAIGAAGFKVRNLARFRYDVEYGAASDARVLGQAHHQGAPPIRLVLTESLPYWRVQTAHAVVLVDWGDEYATLNDPMFADRQVVSIKNLLLAWSDFDQLFAIISPAAGAEISSRHGLPRE